MKSFKRRFIDPKSNVTFIFRLRFGAIIFELIGKAHGILDTQGNTNYCKMQKSSHIVVFDKL